MVKVALVIFRSSGALFVGSNVTAPFFVTWARLTFVEVMPFGFQPDGGQRFVGSSVVGATDDVHPTEGRKSAALLQKDPAFVDDVADRFSRQI